MIKQPWYKYLLAAADCLVLYASFFLALKFYHMLRGRDLVISHPVIARHLLFAVGFTMIAPFILSYYNLYNNSVYTTRLRQLVAIVRSLLIYSVLLALLSFATKSSVVPDSRLTILFYLLISICVMAVWRIAVFRTFLSWVMGSKLLRKSTILVGDPGPARDLFESLKGSTFFDVTGFISTGKASENPVADGWAEEAGIVSGTMKDIERTIESVRPASLLIAKDDENHDRLFDLIDECRRFKIKLFVCSRLLGVIPQYVVVERFGEFSLIDITLGEGPDLQPYWQRPLDIVLASAALVLLSPFLLFLTAVIKLTSTGPILYRQTRIGRNGKPFTFYKFRSMYVGSDKDSWREQTTVERIRSGKAGSRHTTKVVNEENITKIGAVLRKTSLDELPQLFNVIKGDMSMVGPRPCLPYEWENYSKWHRRRFSVTPGCTGLWQVTARSKVGFDDTVVLDMYYIYNKSTWFDFKIMFQTLAVIVLGTGGA